MLKYDQVLGKRDGLQSFITCSSKNCISKKITSFTVAHGPKAIEGVSSSGFEAFVVGKTIVACAARRKGISSIFLLFFSIR
jgi:hypothetical protein